MPAMAGPLAGGKLQIPHFVRDDNRGYGWVAEKLRTGTSEEIKIVDFSAIGSKEFVVGV
jgi:hypothetical protein